MKLTRYSIVVLIILSMFTPAFAMNVPSNTLQSPHTNSVVLSAGMTDTEGILVGVCLGILIIMLIR